MCAVLVRHGGGVRVRDSACVGVSSIEKVALPSAPADGEPKSPLKKKTKSGASEMPQWLRALASLQRTHAQSPASTWQLTVASKSSSRECDALFWPLWAPSMSMVYIHACRHSNIHIKI